MLEKWKSEWQELEAFLSSLVKTTRVGMEMLRQFVWMENKI